MIDEYILRVKENYFKHECKEGFFPMNTARDILFITPYFTGSRGNVTTTLRIKEGYEKQGHSVSIFAYAEGGT
jgi:hypothetical protein